MGIVYKAHDTRLDRHVALKFLPPDLTRDPEARLRFIREAKAASALQHENICVVHDIDQTEDDQTYIVLEYYDGGTIKDEIANGPLPLDKAIDIAIHAEQIVYLKRMMAERIAFHTGQPLERIETDSDRDRWFTADEAAEYGFIDKVIDRSTATAAAGSK